MGGVVWVVIPIMALMIPIVAVLSHHQQKMAQIIHGGNGGDPDEIANLRQEIRELKALVHQQAITLDNIAGAQRALNPPPHSPDLAERLGNGI